MAEEKTDARDSAWRQLFPWTELFRCFKVAVDPNKLLLAAAGIFVMWLGWWVLAGLFCAGSKDLPPQYPGDFTSITDLKERWEAFKRQRDNWNLVHETAGLGSPRAIYEIEDLAESPADFDKLEKIKKEQKGLPEPILILEGIDRSRAKKLTQLYDSPKPYGTLVTPPWSEPRGPNPYLMVTGQARSSLWDPGHFWDWLISNQLPVMIEPLVKIVRPIVYFFSPRATAFTTRFYFLLVALWTIATWSVFGGAITRIAAVEVARGEKIGLGEALRFTTKRWLSYLAAPLFPLLFVLFLLILTAAFGLFYMIPVVGDIFVAGLFWWVPLLLGLAMACTLVGLAVGWPLMAPTISSEGTDSWEAVSRSFTYVFQRPWHYIWYSLVGLCYGAVAVFFIGFMGSFTVYLAEWGVNTIQPQSRNPSFLFVYAPTSFDWRTLLLQKATFNGQKVVQEGQIDPELYAKFVDGTKDTPGLAVWNKTGAIMVAFWLGILFLMLIGFGYSFFWSMSTIIYLLMRRHVDTAEMDEVYLEEDEQEVVPGGFPAPPPAPPGSTAPKPTGPALTMVEPPTMRQPQAPAPTAPAPSTAPPGPAPGAPLPKAPESGTATVTRSQPLPLDGGAPKPDADDE